ncbi:hypothetical protein SAMN02745206_03588 [Desulfacinum infernum DSM 9756]|jgi:hypothetical protein|uniref:Uncharacterized protein n=1 Tax=Desulfacinum infernum DSM 9756 TaxID=1121391 RepID=A0A1M5IGK2_9BACT|nr:ParM/StbA family protein [Desulfacinum infernum]SHG27209.1 hypothetical protein SAMN02745206_03588 [Desulfacinum infernum DSM 9756]
MQIGLDIGFGEVKLAARNGKETNPLLFSFPSVYAKYVPSPMDATNKIIVEYRDKRYLVGEDAKRERAQIAPADFDDIMDAAGIYVSYIRQTQHIGDLASVVASVPPIYWTRKDEYRERLAKLWENVGVVPQGLGIAQVVANRLEPETRHLVIDIGYNTVDHLLIETTSSETGETIVRTRRGGTWRNCGVTFLVDLFRAEMGETDLRTLRFHTLKEFLRTGQANFHGETIDLSGAKRRAADHYKAALGSRIKEEFGGETDHIDGMIVAGGGVYYFDPQDLFAGLPVIVPENPEFANAIGQMLLA